LGLEEEEAEERYELVIVETPQAEKVPQTQEIDQTEEASGAEHALIPKDAPDATNAPVYYDPEGEFTVQVGVYADAQTARRMVRELTAEGYPAYAVPNPGKKGTRVRIGYFKTRSDARRFGAIFKQDRDMDFWVDRRANEKF
jgi:cell division septation protein DedD